MHQALQHFHPLVGTWFGERFSSPTEPQAKGWAEIAAGRDTLIMAPTGSGKTLAAFLAGLDRLVRRALDGSLEERVSMVYVSPLKALGADIERNLVAPLRGLEDTAPRFGRLLLPIRTAVRSGDSTAAERARIIKHPPHVLITTPESLYLLLTSAGGQAALAQAETVIVDEIHALLGNKRGSHLALSLERLDALCGRRLQRIGLSATVEPPLEAARFLTGCKDDGEDRPCSLVDAGRAQPMDVRVEIPKETLGAVPSRTAWGDVYDRLHEYLRQHKTTLIFVPSRRLAERVAHDLEERFIAQPEPDGTVFQISAHHGALAKRTRQKVEQRLQKGELRAVVATASLELGIDIGDIELVCQLGSPRSLAVLRQRIGRAGHAVGGTPKGRIFAMTRDELVEVAAAVRAMRRGRIDRGVFRDQPLDILAQQMVAMCGGKPDADGESGQGGWDLDALYALCRRAAPYRRLSRVEFDQVLEMLSDGIATRRGRSGAHLHLDRVHSRVRPRRGARLAALTSGGAIPDKADYQVVEHSTEAVVGTLDEDFAIESSAGDVFLLGTTPWKVRRVEAGRVRVELALGQNAGPPFWNGEGLARTEELSEEVSQLRVELWERLATSTRADNLQFLDDHCALDEAGAIQVLDYLTEAGQALGGAIPSQNEVVAERFFDDSGAMQLIVHAPFGARINRAWGLGLRKKFCRTFDFELQAAATDDAILLSLGEQHSFPLESIFGFLNARTIEETLVQAALQSPMWETRWRWNTTRALAVLRFSSGKRTAPYLLRMRAADLLAAVFPAAAGCQDNHGGAGSPEALELPDHPLVNETKRDCLEEVMDFEGLKRVLERLKSGDLKCTARDTVAASPFSHAIIAANPYSFLDDAPLEERRTRAVSTARPGELLGRAGDLCTLDPVAIAAVLDEARPDPRDADELHDLLYTVGILTSPPASWTASMQKLVADRRAVYVGEHWAAVERLGLVLAAYPDARISPATVDVVLGDVSVATTLFVHGSLQSAGPVTAAAIGVRLALSTATVEEALGRLEADGLVLQGQFVPSADGAIQFCDRRILQRIHRRTLGRLRADVRPVSPAQLVRFQLRWQHVAPGTRLHGPEGVLKIIEQLEGAELPPLAWEREVLPARVDGYKPEWLDELCFAGEVAWARLHLREADEPMIPTKARHAGRVSLFLRAHAPFLLDRWPVDAKTGVAQSPSQWPGLSAPAQKVAEVLERRGAAFVAELGPWSGLLPEELDQALWELTKAGAVAADGFSALRALLTPPTKQRRQALGRWSLLHRDLAPLTGDEGPFLDGSPVELAKLYLRRYGIVMRSVLGRETAAPSWRELVAVYRRLEARGEIRGGRFVSGLTGEQFALPEAVDALQALTRVPSVGETISVSAVDPLNLVGILMPGSKIPAILGPAHRVVYEDGVARPEPRPELQSVTSTIDSPGALL